eukprot:m.48426 g.48426  ORF g.48426 m.48426 type:complete len:452 (-) comp6992_c0_seq2:89-1444(-)
MGVFAEEGTIERHVSSLFGRCKWQTGVIIGAVTDKRHFAVAVIPTPPEDVDSAGDFASLDKEWVALHAEQVRQALPGGLDIVGVYLFGSGKVDYATKLRQLVYTVCGGAGGTLTEAHQFVEQGRERIALHVCADTKKMTCRLYDIDNPKGTARPTDWKYKAFASKWHTLRCGMEVGTVLNLPAPDKGEAINLESSMRSALTPELERLAASRMMFGGRMRTGDSALPDVSVIEAAMLVPVGDNCTVGADAPVAVAASVQIAGQMTALAVVPPKSTVEHGERALKADVVRSLQARCLSVCRGWDEDRADDAAGDAVPGAAAVSKPVERVVTRLPLRVTAPLFGPILLSDYIAEGDNEEYPGFVDSIERFSEVFGLAIESAVIKPEEAIGDSLIDEEGMSLLSAYSTSASSSGLTSVASTETTTQAQGTDNVTMMLAAAAVLILAISLGVLMNA